ncbi:MAG: nucleotide exchange factor GrpE [Terracidiphilus sp.]|jgi:molecular chaperone GrpE (heat shock protein)
MNNKGKVRAVRQARENSSLTALKESLAEAANQIREVKETVDEVAEDNMAVLDAVRRAGEGQEAFRATLLQEMDKLRSAFAGELTFHALRNCCRELAPVVSALERMLQGADFNDAESTRLHVASFAQSMEGVLRRMGIERVAVEVGTELFDGRIHDCVRACTPAESPFPESPPGTIVRVEEHGYRVLARLAIPARVWVQSLETSESESKNGVIE